MCVCVWQVELTSPERMSEITTASNSQRHYGYESNENEEVGNCLFIMPHMILRGKGITHASKLNHANKLFSSLHNSFFFKH